MMAYETVDSDLFPAMLCRHRCPVCLAVLTDSAMLRSDQSCPECGAVGQVRQTWPALSIVQLLKIGQHFFGRARAKYLDENQRVAGRLGTVVGRKLSPNAARAAHRAFCSVYRSSSGDYEQVVARLGRFFRCDRSAAVHATSILSSGEFSSPDVIVVPLVAVSALESLLVTLLQHIRVRGGMSYDDARKAVSQLRSFEQRFDDFAELTGFSFGEECETIKPGYSGRALRVRKERNRFVHGSPYALGWDACQRALQVAIDSIWVFAQLNNRFVVHR